MIYNDKASKYYAKSKIIEDLYTSHTAVTWQSHGSHTLQSHGEKLMSENA